MRETDRKKFERDTNQFKESLGCTDELASVLAGCKLARRKGVRIGNFPLYSPRTTQAPRVSSVTPTTETSLFHQTPEVQKYGDEKHARRAGNFDAAKRIRNRKRVFSI